MIVLLTIILVISIVSSCWSVYCFLNIKKKETIINESQNNILDIFKEISNIRNDINKLKDNPAEYSRKFSLIDFRLKKMEDVLASFNNGFKYQDSWMR